MELKEWGYDEFPEFAEVVEGAFSIPTTGDEIGVRYLHNVEYARVKGASRQNADYSKTEDIPLHLQILLPFTRNGKKGLFPCVVFVQGSAWFEQDVFGQLPMIAKLAERGYVVAVVEYRHSGIASFPAQAVDARNAVRFMKKNAAEYQIDPDKVILAGDSSGGHTAMFGAILQDDEGEDNLFPGVSAEVKGIVNYYGSVSVIRDDSNPSTMNHCLPDSPEGQVMGGVNLQEHPELKKKLSVECNITENTCLPPTIIIHGTKDRIVNTWGSVDLYRRMKECGKDVELYLLKGGDHSGAGYWMPQVLDIVERFIQKCLQ